MRDAFNASSKKNIFMKHSVSFNVTEADIQLGDQLSDSDLELHYTFNNPQEKYVHGMGKGKEVSRANVNVSIREDGERAGYAARNFLAGDFVCEYAATVKLKETSLEEQETYKSLGLGCFCLDAEYNGRMYTFDATATINDPGRYINHRSRDYNLVIMKPIFVNGKLRIGLSAKRDIKCGEELYFDYGVRDKEIPWLITKPTKRKKKKQTRIRKYCVFDWCTSKPVKLMQHLRQYHKLSDKAELEKLCKNPRKVNLCLHMNT